MDEATFQTKLAELTAEIESTPGTERAKLADEAQKQKLRDTIHSLQESIDYLRLSIKYLLFDLEATRRENGYLRKMIEEDPRRGDE
ncbi:MAG: transcriptional regulator [Proteobacteria bacterium]|nr:MAG: transcriptional regulator [Pseudomonadota bacterium]